MRAKSTSPSSRSRRPRSTPPRIPRGSTPDEIVLILREWCSVRTPALLATLYDAARDTSVPIARRIGLIERLLAYGGLVVPRRTEVDLGAIARRRLEEQDAAAGALTDEQLARIAAILEEGAD